MEDEKSYEMSQECSWQKLETQENWWCSSGLSAWELGKPVV